jgi:hypothetical protein
MTGEGRKRKARTSRAGRRQGSDGNSEPASSKQQEATQRSDWRVAGSPAREGGRGAGSEMQRNSKQAGALLREMLSQMEGKNLKGGWGIQERASRCLSQPIRGLTGPLRPKEGSTQPSPPHGKVQGPGSISATSKTPHTNFQISIITTTTHLT